MRTHRRILIGLAVAALLPATVSAQKVNYDFNADQNFTRLKTYAFRDGTAAETKTSETTIYDSPLIADRTNEAIAAQLQARGMRRDDKHPDVYVTARREFRKEYVVYGYPYGWGYPYGGYPYGWGYGGPGYTETLVYGTLIIDIADASNGELIWRGTGEKRVHRSSSPEHRTKRVVREVAKIFRNFPPPDRAVATGGHDVPPAVDR
jgi:uncharacterized protein DUF4136